jgi:hypothetical protein
MNQSPLRRFVLGRIEEEGRRQGAPAVTFSDRKISIPGEDIYVANGFWWFISLTSGFFLALPPNAYGVVISPDGKSHNMEGGVHEAPPGLYKLQYVDKHERLDFTAPTSEMTTDGEKLTLKVIVRYRVVDPITALQIERPVETLIEHIEADVAQYIRTHDHTDIADSSENHTGSKLLSFFIQRHNRRLPLSKAISITGIELKEFNGDNEYVQMRRKARIEERKNKFEKEQVEYQQELGVLKAQYKADNEKSMALHTAELEKKEAEHRAEMEKKAVTHRSEIEKREAEHRKEKEEILHQVHIREIELDDRRKHLQRRENEFAKAIDAISATISSGYPMNANIIKTMTDLVAALKEEVNSGPNPAPEPEAAENKPPKSERQPASAASPAGSDKVEKLTNTLLNLLNPKK